MCRPSTTRQTRLRPLTAAQRAPVPLGFEDDPLRPAPEAPLELDVDGHGVPEPVGEGLAARVLLGTGRVRAGRVAAASRRRTCSHDQAAGAARVGVRPWHAPVHQAACFPDCATEPQSQHALLNCSTITTSHGVYITASHGVFITVSHGAFITTSHGAFITTSHGVHVTASHGAFITASHAVMTLGARRHTATRRPSTRRRDTLAHGDATP